MSAEILIVDDEADIRTLIKGILEDHGYRTRLAQSSSEAYAQIAEKRPDLVVLDIWLQGSKDDGMQILQTVKEEAPNLPVIMISGHGTIETAVSSIKEGAYDFIEKPFKSDRLLLMIKRALETAVLKKENAALKKSNKGHIDLNLIGRSARAQELRDALMRVAVTNSRVLISGEPGTGKDVAARILHKHSSRADNPFVALSCATLHPERLELELFGGPGEEGALEKAHGGTLLLDEVADMPLETQGKILRAIQEQRFQKIGSSAIIETDVRVISSTNKDLEELIATKNFREDLYYRLNVVPVSIPALRFRVADIPDFIEFFVEALHRESGLPKKSFSGQAIAKMQAYVWPGNVRQLRNVIEWTLIMGGVERSTVVNVQDLPPEISGLMGKVGEANDVCGPAVRGDVLSMPLREAREMFEREYLESQIDRFEGNVSKTAEFIGMERSALHRKLKSLKDSGLSEDTKRKRA